MGPERVKRESKESLKGVQRESVEGPGRSRRVSDESQERVQTESGEGSESLQWLQREFREGQERV